jgi:MFS family permease
VTPATSSAERNRKRFIAFRVFFNARFYYPVLAVLFLDLGLTAAEYSLLNFVWALLIVCAEVPSGALADRIGRRPLVIAAAVCMVLEMLALLVAPVGGGVPLLLLCLINRVLSGTAEALASGADEALAYDSLALEGRGAEWPQVLADVMRWQAIAMFIALPLGAAVYDPQLINQVLVWLGSGLRVDQSLTLRLPIALNLLSALIVLWLALGMCEAPRAAPRNVARARDDIVASARWILRTPLALFAIVGGVLIDSVIRLLLTFNSVYFRLIDLPAASFGVIGALLAGIGLLVAPLVRELEQRASTLRNYAIIAALALFGLIGVALRIPLWGVLFSLPLAAAMAALGFFMSNTLNALVAADHRATVLSFKGLVFNLGYGFASLVFGLALRSLRDGGADQAFADALAVLPLWLAFTLALLTLLFWRRRSALSWRAARR